MDNDGTAYRHTIYNCQTNTWNILICAMEDIEDTPQQYDTGWLKQLVPSLALSEKMARTYASLVTLQLTESRLTPYLTLEVRLTLSVLTSQGYQMYPY